MTFQKFSDTYIPLVDRYITSQLTHNFSDNRHTLEQAILYSATNPAKRIRPLLCIATAELVTIPVEHIIPLAAAFEMMHAYSLIHDDLPAMDNDDLRRGLPTCHIKYGEDIAILAGDCLNTYCFEMLSTELPKYFEARNVLSCIQKFANSCGIHGMAGGQALDLLNHSKNNNLIELETTHSLKTGAIIHSCFLLPSLLSTTAHKQTHTLSEIGKKVGLLFQIIDDILDVKSDTETLGKTAGKDEEQDKCTYVSYWGLEKAELIAKETYEDILTQINDIDSSKKQELVNIIDFIYQRQH